MSACDPVTVTEAIESAGKIDFSTWASRKDHLIGDFVGKKQESHTKSQGRDGQVRDNQQHNFDKNVLKNEESAMQGSTQGFDRRRRTKGNVHLSFILQQKATQKREGAKIKCLRQSTSTIWKENCTSLSRKHRAELMEKFGFILVCDSAALARDWTQWAQHLTRCTELCFAE